MVRRDFGQEGFWPGGILVRRDFGRRDFGRRDFGIGGIFEEGFWQEGFWSGGILVLEGFWQRDFGGGILIGGKREYYLNIYVSTLE